MKKLMPQEVEVWYLIPAIRREFSNIFTKDYNLNQKETAKILGITESAVSQYLKSSRGSKANFSIEDKNKIKISAEKVINGKKDFMKVLYNLCLDLRKSRTICTIHKNQDKSVPKDCDICFG
ncbi:MAG: hypothetical protein WDZ77_03270 [Candidatus Pacearchaeota archaeon]